MERKHRVLFVIPNLKQGGAERQILQLMRRLPDRFESALCLFNDGRVHYPGLLPDGEPRHVLGARVMGRTGLRRLADVFRRERPHIVHSYRDIANFWVRMALPRAPVPVVVTSVRNQMMALRHLATEWYLSRRSDRVVVNSEGLKSYLVRTAGVDARRVQVIHNVLEAQMFHPPSEQERRAARARFGLDPAHVALLLPGRLSFQKHQIGLLHALALLREAGRLSPQVRVLLAGGDDYHLVAAVVHGLERCLRLGPWLRWLGPVTEAEMPALYHATDVLAMPSLWEGLSNCIIEGHASGLPAVVSHAANLDGLVVDGSTGFEAPTKDARAFAGALERVLALDADARRRMGALGREHVLSMLAPERVVSETVALYDALLSEKGFA